MGSRACAFVAVLAAGLIWPVAAHALISTVHPIAGPGADVVDLGGTAMSEDGSGGVVFRRRVDGRLHIFAARLVNGRWSPALRVDSGQRYDSSWPRIAAGDDGRLVVTWVQEFGPGTDRMFSAALDPGARAFQAPVAVDLNVGEATATWPSIAMNRGGDAYLVYRVVTDTSSSNPPGYVGADYRLARYDGSLWTRIGRIDRNPAIPVRTPNADNAPKVAIDVQGHGMVAFQEPGDDFVDRIYARRLFGSSIGNPLLASPTTYARQPLRGGVDAFSLDLAGFGEAAIAMRQLPGAGGALGAPRVFVNQIPEEFADGAGAFQGARLADGGLRGALGAPAVAVSADTAFSTAFGNGGATLLTSGDEGAVIDTDRVDTGRGSDAPAPRVDLSETGAGVVAWRELNAGRGSVGIQERRADGVPDTSSVSAPLGGRINQMEMGGSGLGDALVAWHQGGASFGQVAAAVVDAPPGPFNVLVPDDWQRGKLVKLEWEVSDSAVSPVTYTVSIDDEPVRERIRSRRARLNAVQLTDGVHQANVIAVDSAGQETTSRTGQIKVDRHKPLVALRVRGRTLTVRVTDATSKVRSGSTRIAFGDRKSSRRASVRHRYARAGRYLVTVRSRDRAGNRVSLERRVRVR